MLSERMHDRWLEESRGKEPYTEWLEARYAALQSTITASMIVAETAGQTIATLQAELNHSNHMADKEYRRYKTLQAKLEETK